MKKRIIGLLAAATMLLGVSASAAEAVERDYAPEEGKGWLVVEINGEEVEFEYTSSTKGMTGTTHNFEAEDYTMALVFNKKLVVGEEMDKNAIAQIEIMSHATADNGYYFAKKAAGKDVVSTVTLAENETEGVLQGEFTVTVPTADRYVGDNKPGILPELELTEGEFCFFE
ncbi:MAG: hypothetical protein HFG96_05105 [Lachnospiraceae bacterium]|jgi:hypothetical protein|nr:hypothetical protein [Lachnospiraceae bacterium]